MARGATSTRSLRTTAFRAPDQVLQWRASPPTGGGACYSKTVHDLNDEQRKAATAGDGPVIISAGPGTGKTKTLTARILHLIESGRAHPHEILALTFTKKAAEEMAARVGRKGPVIGTFHALCSTLLGAGQHFATEPDRLAIVKALSKPSSFKGVTARELALRISRAKNQAEAGEGIESLVAAYDTALRDKGMIDFDDLLIQARDLLRAQPGKRPPYKYILVDEFQDTNLLQYELLDLLRQNDNLFVIGDPNQSIYGFRGASGDIFDRFKADFPGHKDIHLARNYRSAKAIVALSNAVFPDTAPLRAQSDGAGRVHALQLLNEYSEAHWIIGEIQQRIGGADLLQGTHHDARASLRDFAILYRNRAVATAIQKYVAESGLPYQVVGEGSPYERPDVMALVALLRWCAGEIVEVPGFSEHQVATLLQKIDTSLPPVDLAYALAGTFALATTADLKQVIGTLVRFKDIASVARHFDELASNRFYDASAEAITLLTIHAAKGLEFPHVFLIAAEEGVLPSGKGDTQEERRLFYVAATRAKEDMDITFVTRRSGKIAQVSQFVAELPATVLPRAQDPNLAADKRRLQKRQAKRAQTSLF